MFIWPSTVSSSPTLRPFFVELERVDDLVLLGDFHSRTADRDSSQVDRKSSLPSNQTRSMTWPNGLLYVSASTAIRTPRALVTSRDLARVDTPLRPSISSTLPDGFFT